MSYAYASARPPLRRPRMIGESLVLGQSIVLAPREVVNGCWMVRQLDTAVLAALLSVAYEKPMTADDPVRAEMEKGKGCAFGLSPGAVVPFPTEHCFGASQFS
jgi:hypothetical protein